LFKTADCPLLVTGDLEVGKPETTRIKSRRIAISSTKWRNIAIALINGFRTSPSRSAMAGLENYTFLTPKIEI